MFLFIRQLIQLLLAPTRGWEDISSSVHNPDTLQRKGLVPLLVVAAASEFMPLIYNHGNGLGAALLSAVAVGLGLFASLYLGKLFLELTFFKYISADLHLAKLSVYMTFMMGLNALYVIIDNALPASMTILKLLPLLSVIIMYRSVRYMGVSEDKQLPYTGLSIIAAIACPIAVCALLMLFV